MQNSLNELSKIEILITNVKDLVHQHIW